MAGITDDAGLPDGISRSSLDHGIGGWWSLVRLAVTGGVLLIAIFGLLGSGVSEPVVARNSAAILRVETPVPLRNGMFFETRLSMRAGGAIQEAVVAIPASVWRDVTINSMIPAPSEEEYERGYFLFRFGSLQPGQELLLKIDGQINPSRQADADGQIQFRDGDRILASAPFSVRVLG